MKTFLTLSMPLVIAITFVLSSKFFVQADYLTSAVFTLACYTATSFWIFVVSSKKLMFH